MLSSHLCLFSHDLHIKQYDYTLKLTINTQKLKIKNLKISKSQSSESGKGIPYGLWLTTTLWATSHFCVRHTLMPRSHWFGTAVDTCGSSLVR